MARAADLILKKPGMNRIKSRTIFVCEGLIRHWTEPLRSTLDPLLLGYKLGVSAESSAHILVPPNSSICLSA